MYIQWDSAISTLVIRFLTLFYYLNEPTLGGETAFPIAENETLAENEVWFCFILFLFRYDSIACLNLFKMIFAKNWELFLFSGILP